MFFLIIVIIILLLLVGYLLWINYTSTHECAHSASGLLHLRSNNSPRKPKGLTKEQMKQFNHPYVPEEFHYGPGAYPGRKVVQDGVAFSKKQQANKGTKAPQNSVIQPPKKTDYGISGVMFSSAPASPSDAVVDQDGEIMSSKDITRPGYTEIKRNSSQEEIMPPAGYDRTNSEIEMASNASLNEIKARQGTPNHFAEGSSEHSSGGVVKESSSSPKSSKEETPDWNELESSIEDLLKG